MITSSLIGLVANYFNTNGISLIRTSKVIPWASDSLFNISQVDSAKEISTNVSPNDSGANNNTPIEKEDEELVKNDPPDKTITQEKEIKNNKKEKTNKPEIVTFEKPKNVTLKQAYSLFNNGVKFIDARDEADFLAGYISGSINIPYYDFENHKQKLENLSKDQPLVIYCAGTDCDLSILLANQLSKLEYKQIYIFFGGWLEWYEANYPIENPSEE